MVQTVQITNIKKWIASKLRSGRCRFFHVNEKRRNWDCKEREKKENTNATMYYYTMQPRGKVSCKGSTKFKVTQTNARLTGRYWCYCYRLFWRAQLLIAGGAVPGPVPFDFLLIGC